MKQLLILTVFLILNTVSAQGAPSTCTTFTIASNTTSYAVGSTVTLTATLSGCNYTVGEVDFYNGTTTPVPGTTPLLCTSNSPYTGGTCAGDSCFQCSWTSAGSPTSSYNIIAEAVQYTGTSTSTTKIDLVGDPGASPAMLYPNNPAADTSFGEQTYGGTNNGASVWLEGDDQYCSVNWPYNGYNIAYPDGSCEWMNQANVPRTTNKPVSTAGANSTIDGLDDAMHTLSDFSKFSNSMLSIDGGTVSSTFDNWYPQAAAWIAPSCKGTADYCTSQAFNQLACPSTVSCNQGDLNGRLLALYEPYDYPVGDTAYHPPTVDIFGNWNKNIITPWLNNSYTPASSPYPWCVPPSTTLAASSPAEYTYINQNIACSDGSTCGAITAGRCQNGNACSTTWGTLPYIIACLNYNAAPDAAGFGAIQAYQTCYNVLQSCDCLAASSCTASMVSLCAPSALGRSLNATAYPGDTCNATLKTWVGAGLALAKDEAPKFALRSLYLTDIYNRAAKMQSTFAQTSTALANFFKTCNGCSDGSACGAAAANECSDGSRCADSNCFDGGPAAQLIYARNKLKTSTNPVKVLPNAVIYGWTDKPYPNGHQGYAHIVKVVAFSPGRGGQVQMATNGAGLIQPLLPWVNTWETWDLRIFGLASRDGYVYVDVRRWDEDHSDTEALRFPNNHMLWKFLFHSPGSLPNITGVGLIQDCNIGIDGTTVSYGLLPKTVDGLNAAMTQPRGDAQDTDTLTLLKNAFMLNDEGDGAIDPTVEAENVASGNTSPCTSGSAPSGPNTYCGCLHDANTLIGYGVESHACAEYIASGPGDPQSIQSGSSGTGDSDYSLKFVDCKTLPYANNALSLDDLMSASD